MTTDPVLLFNSLCGRLDDASLLPPPKNVHFLFPRTWKCVTLSSERDLADVVESALWEGEIMRECAGSMRVHGRPGRVSVTPGHALSHADTEHVQQPRVYAKRLTAKASPSTGHALWVRQNVKETLRIKGGFAVEKPTV